MLDYKTDLFLLSDRNYKDFDRIIIAYTKDLGKISLRVRGAYKTLSKLNPSLHFFSIANCDIIKGRSFNYIANASEEYIYKNIISSLKKTSIYFFVIEVLDKMTYDNIEDEKIYNLCIRYFEYLDKLKIKEDGLYIYFNKDIEIINSLYKFLIILFKEIGLNIERKYLDKKILNNKKEFFDFVYFYTEEYLKTEKFFK